MALGFSNHFIVVAFAGALFASTASVAQSNAVKSAEQLPSTTTSEAPEAPAAPTEAPPADTPVEQPAEPAHDEDEKPISEDLLQGDPISPDNNGGLAEIEEIPDIQTIDLTDELAKRTIDAYVLIETKYKDSPIEDYQDFQEFVEKDPRGKEFETDIKSFNFASVTDWSLAVTSVSLAFSAVVENSFAETEQLIKDVEADAEMDKDLKARLSRSLQAMASTENNRKIVTTLMSDAAYKDKIKTLEPVGEDGAAE